MRKIRRVEYNANRIRRLQETIEELTKENESLLVELGNSQRLLADKDKAMAEVMQNYNTLQEKYNRGLNDVCRLRDEYKTRLKDLASLKKEYKKEMDTFIKVMRKTAI